MDDFAFVTADDGDELMHYGTPRHSGRYPYGSGDNPYQRNYDFLNKYNKYKDEGLSDKEIAEKFGISTTELRRKRTAAQEQYLAERNTRIYRMKDKGMSQTAIAEAVGVTEGTVRAVLKNRYTRRESIAETAARQLENELKEKKYIDIGSGVEHDMGLSKVKFDAAIQIMKDKGYQVITIDIPQATQISKYTKMKVLAPPDATKRDVWQNRAEIQSIGVYTENEGKDYRKFQRPTSIDSSRVLIRYAEEGGKDKDGTIELRRGVNDISLGASSYAQVRIGVDDKMYMKGMAFYSDDIPKGYDVIYNTNKHVGTDPAKVFKEMKKKKVLVDGKAVDTDEVDWDNPFGAAVKPNGQKEYIDIHGNKQLSCINILKEEGDWDHYSKSLSSQFLSKQPKALIKRQLELASSEKHDEFEKIMMVQNPALRKKFLDDFSKTCDKAAVDLKAAALPRQTSKVILPVPSLKDTEVYAPGYSNGEEVVLIRYPHAGTFEIPRLIVNNRQKDASKMLGNSPDAIGINPRVAEQLSGADFDGDSVVVIPVNSKVNVKTSKPLEGLKNFDPKEMYPGYPGMPVMTDRQKGLEMGNVSNLITDMTLKGAPEDQIERAVKHSMVVIDAQKHKLNWKLSEEQNGIAALKKEWQGGAKRGASTLISRASSQAQVAEFEAWDFENDRRAYKPNADGTISYKETGKTRTVYVTKDVIDPETGKKTKVKVYNEDGSPKVKEVPVLTKTTKMALVDDAFELSSGTVIESYYANYANDMKALANRARKETMTITTEKPTLSAKEIYAPEIASLNEKLKVALMNAPRERMAQLKTSVATENKRKQLSYYMSPDEKESLKKYATQTLNSERIGVGANKKDVYVQITPKEWEAISNGAISASLLTKIINNTDTDKLKELAMPRPNGSLTSTQINLLRTMDRSGYTISEIAERLGISESSVTKYMIKSKQESEENKENTN